MDSLVMVYHGTSLCRAQAILWTGVVRADAPKIWPNTQNGFVYVSLDFGIAGAFARMASTRDPVHGIRLEHGLNPVLRACAILRWRISAEQLLPDEDEECMAFQWRMRSPWEYAAWSRRIRGDVVLWNLPDVAVAFVDGGDPSFQGSHPTGDPDGARWIPAPGHDVRRR